VEESISIVCDTQYLGRVMWFRDLLSVRLVLPLPLSVNLLYGKHEALDSPRIGINMAIPIRQLNEQEIAHIFDRFERADWISRSGRTFVLDIDIVSFAVWMLSRVEEHGRRNHGGDWDEHNRFRFEKSLSCKYGLSKKPVFDLLLKQLIETVEDELNIKMLNRAPWGKGYDKAVWLTHDVDKLVGRYWLPLRVMGWFAFSLRELIRGNLRECCAWVEKTAKWVTTRHDPTYRSIEKITVLESRKGAKSTFFFMSLKNGISFQEGIRYPIKHPKTRAALQMLVSKGWEVGLHVAYQRAHDNEYLSLQRRILEAVMGRNCELMRNHYLRALFPDSWYLAEKTGFLATSNMGWSSINGFRAGTCWPYHPYDVLNDRPFSTIEVPLIYMDTFGKSFDSMVEEAISLSSEVSKVHGLFTINFHSNMMDEFESPDKRRAYEILLREFSEKGWYIIIPGQMKNWFAVVMDSIQ